MMMVVAVAVAVAVMVVVAIVVMIIVGVVVVVMVMRILRLGDELESAVAGKKREIERRKEGFGKREIIKEEGPMVEGLKRIVDSSPCTTQ